MIDLSYLTDSSYVQLVLNASLPVQMVLLLLLLISIYSWTLIFSKSRYLQKNRRATSDFEKHFWKGKDINALYNQLRIYEDELTGMANIFMAGYVEFIRSRKNIPVDTQLTSSQRAMRVALNQEADKLDAGLATLATVGSVSPYIGLFGTVWGIMNSFHALGSMEQITLAMIAPGISEALIATAMGLFAAIPAVMAYNSYTNDIDRLIVRYENFLDEFTSILQRLDYTNDKTHK